MKLYHRTFEADRILAEGFRDGAGYYLTSSLHSGVWLSNVPLDINEGAKGNALLIIDIPENVLTEYQWIEEGKPYREFLVPASLVNQYRPPVLVDEDEGDT